MREVFLEDGNGLFVEINRGKTFQASSIHAKRESAATTKEIYIS